MMGKITIRSSIYGKYNYHFVKLRPNRNILLDPVKYSKIWNSIIEKILESDKKHKLYVVITMNSLILEEKELHSLILDKISKREHETIYEKAYPANKLVVNYNEETEFSEHKYVLAVKKYDLKFLVEKLNDKDALELFVANREIGLDEFSKLIDYGVSDIGNYLNYCIYFNGIHIGLNIEMYNRDIANIEGIFSDLEKIEELNVLFKGA